MLATCTFISYNVTYIEAYNMVFGMVQLKVSCNIIGIKLEM